MLTYDPHPDCCGVRGCRHFCRTADPSNSSFQTSQPTRSERLPAVATGEGSQGDAPGDERIATAVNEAAKNLIW